MKQEQVQKQKQATRRPSDARVTGPRPEVAQRYRRLFEGES